MKKSDRIYKPVESMKHFAQKANDFGDKVLYRYFDYSKKLCEVTYSGFSDMIKKIAAGLEQQGITNGRVAIIGDTSPQWVATYIAAVANGGVAIPLDKDLQISEIKGFLLTGKADAIIYSPFFNDKFQTLIDDEELNIKFIPIEDEQQAEKENVITLGRLMTSGNADYVYPEQEDLNRFAVLLFTSGTTGSSKGVMLSEKNIISSINAACESVEFFYDDTIVSVLPIHHTYELCCMCAAINYGMTICINDTLMNVMKNILLFRPTGIILVPAFVKHMYRKILSEAEKKGKGKQIRVALKASKALRMVGIDVRRSLFKEVTAAFGGRLVKIICGGAPLNPEIAEKFAEFGIVICEGYGITECSPLVAVNPYFALKPGSVGPAVNCCEIKIEGTMQNSKGFIEGEVLVKGDNVMLGYYGYKQEDNPIKDGYFSTGDIGYMDQEGYLYITGRKKSVIISDNGKNISPEELEEYLYECDQVIECIVVGRTSAKGYDKINITAIIFPDRTAFKDDSQALEFFKNKVKEINDKLPAYKRISTVELREKEFEKTTSRKIKRFLVN